MKMIFLRMMLLACLVAVSSLARAHEVNGDREHAATARGVVFHDENHNRTRDAGEPLLPNVKVSNGSEIVRTDEFGRYEIAVSDDAIIFVIKPRGWISPLSVDNLPQFYYIHKPSGSPADFKFAGVAPTGPLPESIDFPLYPHAEPDAFKAILFGDPQPRNIQQVEYIAHDVVEQILAEDAHEAAFGVTLGDIAFDDLSTIPPLNQAIALIGIPWYNVIGNHDLNLDAANDKLSDETFERIYGPSYYAFDHGPAHFLVLDDVVWVAAHEGKKAHVHGGLEGRQLQFIRNDLASIPDEQLVVLMMHVPLGDVEDRQELYRLIEQRPAAVSISAHTHYMEHRMIGAEDGWRGAEPHHHIVNVTVCGSWWRGQPDERGIPHATMSDGAPNGYSIMKFNGDQYSLEFRAAGRPADYQMNIYAPESVSQSELATTAVLANVFAATPAAECAIRIDTGDWKAMQAVTIDDPAFVAEKEREQALTDKPWTELPSPHATPHMYRAQMPSKLSIGTHQIQIRWREASGQETVDQRIIRVE